jgi:hypothetical protein
MAGETAWLDGQIEWHEGRVAWRHETGLTTPTISDLSIAQRRLNQIRGYPAASCRALGDVGTWLERRLAGLELAQLLQGIYEPELPTPAKEARAGDPQAIRRLVSLLVVEALCTDPLPVSPSASLVRCGQSAEPLQALLDDTRVPLVCQALAAMTVGAIQRRESAGGAARSAPSGLGPPWLQRSYVWGRQHGLPPEPGLVVQLLADEDGRALARRCLELLQTGGAFRPPASLLRKLLAAGVQPTRVVDVATAVVEAEPLAERLLSVRSELPEESAARRQAAARRLLLIREPIVAETAELIHCYSLRTGDPTVIRLITRLAYSMLDLGGQTAQLAAMSNTVLRDGLQLPPELLRPYLELLVEHHRRLWGGPDSAAGVKADSLEGWLKERYDSQVEPARRLLLNTRDGTVVDRALRLGMHHQLASEPWRDPALSENIMAFVRELDLEKEWRLLPLLCAAFNRWPSARKARAALVPLAQALKPAAHLQEHFLEAFLAESPRSQRDLEDWLPRLVRHVPAFLAFDQDYRRPDCIDGAFASAAVAIDRAVPAEAGVWIEWLLSHLQRELVSDPLDFSDAVALKLAASLAVQLSDRDLARFQAVIRAVLKHYVLDWQDAEDSLSVLADYPALRRLIVWSLPQQPVRCMQLLVRLGLTTRLGRAARGPIEELELALSNPSLDLGCRDSQWRSLLETAPELASSAASYLAARRLIGADDSVPPGVTFALDQPSKLADEFRHLEGALASKPDREDLATRVQNLRSRLRDRERLHSEARLEAGDRLARVAALAQLAAARYQVASCFRARLSSLVRDAPQDLAPDDDLINAALLSVDIKQNRRLLLRLLRAHFRGEAGWREQQPANAAFLKELQERGVDTATWLAGNPLSYPCPGVADGRVHLSLELDPLKMLQMGNYFDTCLSFGGGNAFATVANACELNKRVIYARDSSGRVLGRKLIAITAKGDLVGFRTYTSLGNADGLRRLRSIFDRYCRAFAARCHLSLADSGEVLTLFAQAWYDDGVVAWGQDYPVSSTTFLSTGHILGQRVVTPRLRR